MYFQHLQIYCCKSYYGGFFFFLCLPRFAAYIIIGIRDTHPLPWSDLMFQLSQHKRATRRDVALSGVRNFGPPCRGSLIPSQQSEVQVWYEEKIKITS